MKESYHWFLANGIDSLTRGRQTCDFGVNMPLLRLQSSEGKFTTSHEIEGPSAGTDYGSGTFGAFWFLASGIFFLSDPETPKPMQGQGYNYYYHYYY